MAAEAPAETTDGRGTIVAAESTDVRTSFALHEGCRQHPRALVAIGVMILAATLLDPVFFPIDRVLLLAIGDLVLGATILGIGVALIRRPVPCAVVPWVFSLAMTLVIAWLVVWFARMHEVAVLVLIAAIIAAMGSLSFHWPSFVVAVVAMVTVTVIGLLLFADGDTALLITTEVIAGIGSVLLIRLRMGMLSDVATRQQDLISHSSRDGLTRLLNRHGLHDAAAILVAEAQRRDEPVTVFFLDVRGVKRINDGLGHDHGDEVITDAASAIAQSVRGADLVARWGGDEFVVLGHGLTDAPEAFVLRLNENFAAISRHRHDGVVGPISVGIAASQGQGIDVDALIVAADEDMYARRRAFEARGDAHEDRYSGA